MANLLPTRKPWLEVGMRAAPADQYDGFDSSAPTVLEVKWFPADQAFRARLSQPGPGGTLERDAGCPHSTSYWYHEDELERVS